MDTEQYFDEHHKDSKYKYEYVDCSFDDYFAINRVTNPRDYYVYVLWSADEERAEYVGCTGVRDKPNIFGRLGMWVAVAPKEWGVEIEKVEVIRCLDKEDTSELEKNLIQWHRPKHNRRHNWQHCIDLLKEEVKDDSN